MMWLVSFCGLALVSADWNINSVHRDIKIRPDSIVETRTVYTVSAGKKKDALPFRFVIAESDKVGALRITADDQELVLGSVVSEESREGRDALYAIDFGAVKGKIEVTTLSGNVIRPFPTKAMEMERQRVLFEAPSTLRCLVACGEQTTTVVLPENAGPVESVSPASAASSARKFDFSSAAATTGSDKLKIHFFFDVALPVVPQVVKTIEVSQLGAAVSVHEQVELVNRAAELDGEFNRIPYTHMRYSANSPFKVDHSLLSVDASVPLNAENIHYRDVIGNISSSNAWRDKRLTRVSLRPRFPLLGGWKTEFEFMYVVPAVDGVIKQFGDDEFLLSVPVLHSFANIFAEKQIVKLVLPPGVSGVEISVPGRTVGPLHVENVFSWLDTPLLGTNSGHTQFTFELGSSVGSEKRTISPSLVVKYTLPRAGLYRGPLLLSAYVFALFALFILARRMTLSITDEKEAAAEEAQNADHDVCQKIDDLLCDLWVATSVVLADAADHSGSKPALESTKGAFVENWTEIAEKANVLALGFDSEDNRVRRTNKLARLLKQLKDQTCVVIDTAAAGKDTIAAAGRLVDTEMEIKGLLERVETGDHSSSPPPTPQGSPPKTVSARKRR